LEEINTNKQTLKKNTAARSVQKYITAIFIYIVFHYCNGESAHSNKAIILLHLNENVTANHVEEKDLKSLSRINSCYKELKYDH
jgi:hypothetical protein